MIDFFIDAYKKCFNDQIILEFIVFLWYIKRGLRGKKIF
jgi:hypothetical protein